LQDLCLLDALYESEQKKFEQVLLVASPRQTTLRVGDKFKILYKYFKL